MSHNHNGIFDDETDRLKFRPGQPVQKDEEGKEVGTEAGPGSPTAAASSSGGSGDHIAENQERRQPGRRRHRAGQRERKRQVRRQPEGGAGEFLNDR